MILANQPLDQALAYRRILSGFTIIMMALSWPLWWADDHRPKFPAFGIPIPALNQFESTILLACVSGLILSFSRKFGRLGSGLACMAGLCLVAGDQQRLQAWFYQTLILNATFALLPGPTSIGFARLFAIVLYAHSALSKLDWSFAHSMGPYLLKPILQHFPESWPDSASFYFIMAIPVAELMAAILLASGYLKSGLTAVLLMHSSLFIMLGPWLLNHSGNVLVWNISMAFQALILFRIPTRSGQDSAVHPPPNPIAFGCVQLLFLAVAIMPFFERAGLWDPWPSFALYAGHVEQFLIDFPADSLADIPPEFQPFIVKHADRLHLDTTRHSRALLGVPPYPALRVQKQMARFVAKQCPDNFPVRATFLSKSHWRTGHRSEWVVSGRESILSLK